MLKYWFKHRFGYLLIYIAVLSAIAGGLFMGITITRKAEAEAACSIYEKTQIDFIAPSPSASQVAELNGKEFIEKATPYYVSSLSVTANGKTKSKQEVFFLDSFDDRENSLFTKSRLTTEYEQTENPICVDFVFAREMNVTTGSKVSIAVVGAVFDFTVCGIYETNTLTEKGSLLVEYSGSLKSAIEQNYGKILPYSAVYIKAKDISACKTYLKSEYKPLGLLKTREDFSSDEAYEIHVNGFWNTDFSNQITDMRLGYEEANAKTLELKTTAGVMYTVAILLIVLMFIVPELIFSGRKREQNSIAAFIKMGAGAKQIKIFYFGSLVFEACLSLIVIACSILLIVLFAKYYIALKTIGSWLIGLSAALVGGIIFAAIFDCFKVKKVLKINAKKQ